MAERALPVNYSEILSGLTKDQMVESYLKRHPGFDAKGPVPSHDQLQNAMYDMVKSAHVSAELGAWSQGVKLTHLDDIVSSIGWLSQHSPQQFKGRSAHMFDQDFINNPSTADFARELEFALGTIEKQSPETWTHIQNHTALIMLYFERQCEAEDKVMGLESGKTFEAKKDEGMLLLLGALGHDIGKVGLHPHLLHKSTRIRPDRLETALESYDRLVADYPEKDHDMAFMQAANEGKIIFAPAGSAQGLVDPSMIINVGAGYASGEVALTNEQQRQRHSAIWERIHNKATQSGLKQWLTPEEQQTLTMPKRGTVTDHEMAVIASHDEMSEAFFKAASLPDKLRPLSRIVSMDRFRQGTEGASVLSEEETKMSHIIHATDAMEALLASRSYRKDPLSPDQAISIMKEQADKGLMSKHVITNIERNGTLDIYKPRTQEVPKYSSELTSVKSYMLDKWKAITSGAGFSK